MALCNFCQISAYVLDDGMTQNRAGVGIRNAVGEKYFLGQIKASPRRVFVKIPQDVGGLKGVSQG